MKPYILFLFLVCSVLSVQSQIDSKKKSVSIPAIESEKETPDVKPLTPSKPINENTNFGMNRPKVAPTLDLPKKEFSMFPQEEFGNPGELYTKNLDKLEKEFLPEGHGLYSGLQEDAYWGDYRTKSDYINISYRDHGRIDGDLLRVLVDGDVIQSNISLIGSFQGFRLNLKEGLNKIEFYAINEGDYIPNTAQYRITDEWNKVISGKIWALSKGVKVTIIIVKE